MINNSGSKRDSRQALRTDGFVYYNQMTFFRQQDEPRGRFREAVPGMNSGDKLQGAVLTMNSRGSSGVSQCVPPEIDLSRGGP